MAEINNNMQSFGINNKKVDKKSKEAPMPPQHTADEKQEERLVRGADVLGRSQVTCSKCGGNIAKSVEEAVMLAEQYPQLAECGEELFDSLYESFLADGLTQSEAYAQASCALEEFCEIGLAHLQ